MVQLELQESLIDFYLIKNYKYNNNDIYLTKDIINTYFINNHKLSCDKIVGNLLFGNKYVIIRYNLNINNSKQKIITLDLCALLYVILKCTKNNKYQQFKIIFHIFNTFKNSLLNNSFLNFNEIGGIDNENINLNNNDNLFSNENNNKENFEINDDILQFFDEDYDIDEYNNNNNINLQNTNLLPQSQNTNLLQQLQNNNNQYLQNINILQHEQQNINYLHQLQNVNNSYNTNNNNNNNIELQYNLNNNNLHNHDCNCLDLKFWNCCKCENEYICSKNNKFNPIIENQENFNRYEKEKIKNNITLFEKMLKLINYNSYS
ncbi:hypothetical protein ABK040_007420 [Willaertia magna]